LIQRLYGEVCIVCGGLWLAGLLSWAWVGCWGVLRVVVFLGLGLR